MLFEWLIREGGIVLSWWALVTLAGVAAFPLAARLLSGLPDRGYLLTRALGLLLVGFVFWLLASLGFLRNTPGSIMLAWLIVLLAGVVLYFRVGGPLDWRVWWREHRAAIVVGELLFLVLLFAWAAVRAHNPDLSTTEKPMEMMMLGSVMRSQAFPPHDAWMSGYSISYYYFGYVIAAMLALASGVTSAVAFSMTNVMLFALTGLTAYGVAYNLVRAARRSPDSHQQPSPFSGIMAGLLAMFLMVWMGNFQVPIVEIPYQTTAHSDAYLQFWDTQSRTNGLFAAVPLQSIDWFRASRVLTDRQLNGELEGIQPIDEFPQFSFLLADNHPHVLALPFAALALGLALNVVLTGRAPLLRETIFYGLCLGGLVFLNTWDGPIYMVVLVGAEVLRRRIEKGRLTFGDWMEALFLGIALVLLALLFYLPFFVGFRSQAAGILPNLIWPTQFQQYFIMFGPFLLLLVPFLLWEARRTGAAMNWRLGLLAAGGLWLALLLLIVVLLLVAALVPALRLNIQNFLDSYGGIGGALPALLGRRFGLSFLLTTLVLLALIALVVARLFPRRQNEESSPVNTLSSSWYSGAAGFALLLVGVGAALTLLPDYVYLRDNFGTRINTVFKFYYQAWVAFSIAAAYAVYVVLSDIRQPALGRVLRLAYGALTLLVLVLGALYPWLGIHTRSLLEGQRFWGQSGQLTLDGAPLMLQYYDDYVVLMCLSALTVDDPEAIAVEGIAGSYWAGPEPDTGRIGALLGMNTVLGWENHQSQWRGPTYGEIVGTRPNDIRTLYNERQWEAVQWIIERYGINYVFYGFAERALFNPSGEQKFIENTDLVCESGSSRVYRVRHGGSG